MRFAILHLHQVGAGTFTRKLSNMLSTQGSDRIKLQIAGDPSRAVIALSRQSYVLEISQESDGTIIISTADSTQTIPRMIQQLEIAGVKIRTMRIEQISLEDVFISFTGRHLREERGRAAPPRDPLFAPVEPRRMS
ncbi:MAG: DUF4162 domain-containing protein [Deltaproteobacteria bacterium]|nr:DUF4162 domain-containing protein [Deltaproteobacteria bacterium]